MLLTILIVILHLLISEEWRAEKKVKFADMPSAGIWADRTETDNELLGVDNEQVRQGLL